MRVLRTLRGIAGTALAWTLPWALLGGAMLVGYFAVRYGAIPLESLQMAARVNWILFRVGAEASAIAGALAGSVFATILAVRGRRLTFAQLSAGKLAAYGALGGAGVGAAVVTIMASTLLRPIGSLVPLVGISTVLGAGSAVAMLQLARRGRPVADWMLADSEPDPGLTVQAQEEVERLWSAPDTLTMVGADGRASVAAPAAPHST